MPCAFFHSFLHKLPVVRRILSRKSRGTKVMLLQTSRPRRFPDSSQFLPQLPALSVHSVIGHECHKLLPAVDSPRAKCANKLHTTDRVRVSGKSTRKCQPDARLLCGWRPGAGAPSRPSRPCLPGSCTCSRSPLGNFPEAERRRNRSINHTIAPLPTPLHLTRSRESLPTPKSRSSCASFGPPRDGHINKLLGRGRAGP